MVGSAIHYDGEWRNLMVDEPDKSEGLPLEVIEALAHGRKLLAIKRLREATGMDLAAAREEIEKHIQTDPNLYGYRKKPHSDQSLWRFAVIALALSLVLAILFTLLR